MTRRRPLLSALAAVSGLCVGLSEAPGFAQHAGHGPQQAVFATNAEAEAAAKHFNCQGAHKMGNQWMPCAGHGEGAGAASSHPAP